MTSWGRLLIAVAPALAGLSASAPATQAQPVADGVNATVTMDYYDVSGRTWPEVLAAIFAGRPLIPGTDERFEGVTTYKVELGPTASVNSGQCSSDSVTVNISVVIKVPRLSEQARLSKDDQECWAFYDRFLTDHEEGHMQLAIQDGEALAGALRAARGASCQALQTLAERRAEDMRDGQSRYDVATDHGKVQWRRYGLNESADSDDTKELRRRCIGLASERLGP